MWSSLYLLAAALPFIKANPLSLPVSIDVLPGQSSPGKSTVDFTSKSWGLDSPKVLSANSSVFDWWYFDAVAPDSSASAVFIAFNADPSGLWVGSPIAGTTTWFCGLFSFPNGTVTGLWLPSDKLSVMSVEDGSSATFGGMNAGWVGTPDMKKYVVAVNEPDSGMKGTMTLKSTAPAHLACTTKVDKAGQDYELSPGFGWTNAVPDADTEVDLTIQGSPLKFTGYGYHDKNWGAQPVDHSVKSWYWGHARVGPYSVVWFDDVDNNDKHYVSSYVAKGGKALAASCSDITIRPVGNGATYPPNPATPLPNGYHIEAVVPGQGTLTLDVKHARMISYVPGTLGRWIGTVTGGFKNTTEYQGAALYEQFTFDN